ncbi:MAG TPA: putative toxin-antitoxin system toxin component, PIN family [Thermomicrobiales bacterium]|jgi:putative PIN family toxin of toxin-antitoxin system
MSERSARLRTVVDTNLFFSGTIFKRGKPFALLEAWRAQSFDVLVSEAQYKELLDVFSRPKILARYPLTPDDIDELFAGLAAAPRAEPSPVLPLELRDPEDHPILAAALGGGADYLITGDKDLQAVAGDSRLGLLKIVKAAEFLAILDAVAQPSIEEDDAADSET